MADVLLEDPVGHQFTVPEEARGGFPDCKVVDESKGSSKKKNDAGDGGPTE